jgi:hypothetical protein
MPKKVWRPVRDRKFREAAMRSEGSILHEPKIGRLIAPLMRRCLRYEGLDSYRIMRGGDCVNDYVDIIMSLCDPRNRILIFTRDTVKVYGAIFEPSYTFLSTLDNSRYGYSTTEIRCDGKGGLVEFDSKRGVYAAPRSLTEVRSFASRAAFSSSIIQMTKTKEVPRRQTGLPYDLNQDKFGILIRPDKKRSIIVRYHFYQDPGENLTGDKAVYAAFDTRLNGYDGPDLDPM